MPRDLAIAQLSAALAETAKDVGRLTAVDGAVLLNTDLEVLGFGAMIKTGELKDDTQVVVLEPGVSDSPNQATTLAALGGSRHRSAAEYCNAQKEALAFVASQDGPLTLVGYLKSDGKLFSLKRADLYLF
jgi:hypothetical protein